MVGGSLFVVFFALLVNVSMWQVRANEYFGDGVMAAVSGEQLAFSHEHRFVGVIAAWGWYWIYGTAGNCRIVPLWSPVGDATTVRCAMVFNEKDTIFRGWMDFRGHPRPFCGTRNGEYPRTCFGEY